MTEAQARAKILEMVAAYHDAFHTQEPFAPGRRIPYGGRVYDSREMVSLAESALDFWLSAGRFAAQFEKDLADYLDVRHCALVNSGSSANLLAFMALTSPLLGERAIKPGDEVITPAAAFPTTVSPIVQFGAAPVFVDIAIPQYNIDVEALESALSPKTRAVMAAHTLGNPFDLSAVKDFCCRRGLWLIEDNCDALGSLYELNGTTKLTGSFGDIGTSSFYPAHHITLGEGGALYTNDPLLDKIIRSLRDWGRDCVCAPGQDNSCGHRFDRQYGQLPLGYDHKYVYSHLGYNLKATDMQAAIGVEQLKKLPGFVKKRRKNFDFLHSGLTGLEDKLILPEPCPRSQPSWFGFILTCSGGADRSRAVNFLERRKIQTRSLFSGNLLRHPCFDHLRGDKSRFRVIGDLPNTERVTRDSFWVGVYPGLTEEQLAYMLQSIIESVQWPG
jgi:CDP-6-deoxy-D-xylo-4-hexulose-3-dehydrase